MYANNEIGSIQPIVEIGAVCKEKGVYFHTDAVQAVGHLSINVKEQNIDMMSASAHKFHGPKGVGFLYARKGILLSNIIEGGAQERGKRAGTENIPAIVGMAAALHEVAHGSLRLSLSEYNTQEEVDYVLEELPKIVTYLRNMSPVWDELEKGEKKHVI